MKNEHDSYTVEVLLEGGCGSFVIVRRPGGSFCRFDSREDAEDARAILALGGNDDNYDWEDD